MEVGVRELKANLSEYLDRVEAGEIIVVTNRGRVVALITPQPGRDRIAQGIAEGWISRAVDRPPQPVQRHPARPGAATTTALIREDRGP